MMGMGPKETQSGRLNPNHSRIPAAPPIRRFLNKVIQAKASVQEGRVYGRIAILAIILLPGKSVLTTSQARTPPINKASIDMGKMIKRVFSSGSKNSTPFILLRKVRTK